MHQNGSKEQDLSQELFENSSAKVDICIGVEPLLHVSYEVPLGQKLQDTLQGKTVPALQ